MLSGDQLFVRRREPSQGSLKICIAALSLFAICAPIDPAAARSTSLRPQVDISRTYSPLLLLVSIKKQQVHVFDANGEVTSSRISSGQPGFDTPTGVFSILEKNEYHESNIYEGAPMPFMQRLTWSGIALHAGVVPGYRASHGCIRLPASFAKSLFGITKVGARVVVSPDEVTPIPFDHPNLFKPLPAETPKSLALQSLGEETKVAANDVGGSLTEIPQFLGVSAALAEAARDPNAFLPDRPRSRAEVDRMTTEKVTKLQSAIKTAETQKQATSEKAKRAVKEAEAAGDAVAKAKEAIDATRPSVETADKKVKQSILDFEAFMSGVKSSTKPGQKASQREAELEEAILDMTVEAANARADVARRELDLAAAQGASTAAEATRTAMLDGVSENQILLRSAQADLIEANKEIMRRSKQLSVFISLKTERIYIRQGTEPLLEAPIAINDPSRRVGTHVFTAMRYGNDPNTFDWRLVSAHIPGTSDAADDSSSRKGKRREVFLPHSDESSVRMARAALDAIKIPPDILSTIADLARPGASLIISDRELPANENGLGTEFVVLTR